jgi:hypothetical protein
MLAVKSRFPVILFLIQYLRRQPTDKGVSKKGSSQYGGLRAGARLQFLAGFEPSTKNLPQRLVRKFQVGAETIFILGFEVKKGDRLRVQSRGVQVAS